MSERPTPPWYVLTGGPCAGKTTTIDELKVRGYSVLPESARTVIAAEVANGGSIDTLLADPMRFEHSILAHQQELAAELKRDEVAFLDRGIPDNVAYYGKLGLEQDDALKGALETATYRRVFLLDMIDFASDAERYETSQAEADSLHAAIGAAYRDLGYDVVPVPVLPVSERVDYILARL